MAEELGGIFRFMPGSPAQGRDLSYATDNSQKVVPTIKEERDSSSVTSEERRAARYERRKAKREARRQKALEEYGNYDKIIKRSALGKAAKEATKGVGYKGSVKRYMLRRLINDNRIHHRLERMQDVRKGFICFNLVDRGKLRKIMSVHFSERVPQKSFNKNGLVPIFTRSLIYDNGASQQGKGTSFALKRMALHLRRYYHKHGADGYALVVDFKDYFGQLDHEIAKDLIRRTFEDPRMIWLGCQFIDAYYEHKIKEAKRTGKNPKKVEAKGLGLGSETNQTVAITYPNSLDHYIKEALQVKGYERYMDDLILIGSSKEELRRDLEEIRKKCDALKIEINDRKTYITKLTHGFTFLKTQFILTESGKILGKPSRDAFTRERRKLKKQARLVAQGIMLPEDLERSYASWRGSVMRKQARRKLHQMDRLCEQLINEAIQGGESHGRKD